MAGTGCGKGGAAEAASTGGVRQSGRPWGRTRPGPKRGAVGYFSLLVRMRVRSRAKR